MRFLGFRVFGLEYIFLAIVVVTSWFGTSNMNIAGRGACGSAAYVFMCLCMNAGWSSENPGVKFPVANSRGRMTGGKYVKVITDHLLPICH